LNKVKDELMRKTLLEEVITKGLSFRDIKERVRELTLQQKGEGETEVTTLVRRLEATAKRARKVEHLLEKTQKKKRLQRLLSELEALLSEE
jgi:cell fate (sporulation/competence/biofilm development) regulator YlbF (YheA/YmcA/DUF963 family)